MTEIPKDVGVATALLTEFTEHRLPRALALRDKVERGEKLEDLDIAFMKEVLRWWISIRSTRRFTLRRPRSTPRS